MTDITELDEDCFFGPAPLRADEDHAAYYALLKSLKDTVQPLDIFERIWIRDVADLVWEILRWRRDKLNLVKAKDTKSLKYLDKDAVLIDRSAKIDDIISSGEARRNNSYHELKLHRATFATALRNKIKDLVVSVANENVPVAALQATAEAKPPLTNEAVVEDTCEQAAEELAGEESSPVADADIEVVDDGAAEEAGEDEPLEQVGEGEIIEHAAEGEAAADDPAPDNENFEESTGTDG